MVTIDECSSNMSIGYLLSHYWLSEIMKTYVRIYLFISNVGNFFDESVNSYQILEEYFFNILCCS